MKRAKRVRVLINPKSGIFSNWASIQRILEESWEDEDIDLTYQFSKSIADGQRKVANAVEDNVDVIVVVGGDGMVNSVGSCLIGTDVALGVIPSGSGNGFARHFQIPLDPHKAAKAMATAERRKIDVGTVNDQPFFVTCSMAWDAALVEHYEQSPVRGVLPYVLAGVYGLLEYTPQDMTAVIDGEEEVDFHRPYVFTVANLTEYGGGAIIAPKAMADDGLLELVVIRQRDMSWLVANFAKVVEGRIDEVNKVFTRRFKTLEVRREKAAPIQMDGELIESVKDLTLGVIPKGLTVLVPAS